MENFRLLFEQIITFMEAATYIVGGKANMEAPKSVVLQMATRGGSKSGSILMYSHFKMTIFGAETNIFTARYTFILCRVIHLITLDFVHWIGFVTRCFLSSLPFDCTRRSELFDFFSK